MTKITKNLTPKFPHFKKRQIKTKQKYFLIVPRKIAKHDSELKLKCVLMKKISKNKLEALKLVEISQNLMKKYSKQCFLYPTNKKMKRSWELDIPLVLKKEVTQILNLINENPRKIVIKKKPHKKDIRVEIQEYAEDSIDPDDVIITISSSSSECESPEKIDGYQSNDIFSRLMKVQNELNCKFCSMKFKQQTSLDVHIKRQHQETNIQNELSCTQCNKLLKCKRSLREHLKIIHNCGFSYDVCNDAPNHYNVLNGHKNTKQTLAKHRCGICGASFKDRELYLRHSFEHAAEPFIECKICLKRFFKENHLLEHFKSHKDDNVLCNQCKKFIKKEQLKQHMLYVHPEDKRRFVCTFCNKAYTSKLILLISISLNYISFNFRTNNLEISHSEISLTPLYSNNSHMNLVLRNLINTHVQVQNFRHYLFNSSLYSCWNDLKHMFPLKRASFEQLIPENHKQLELIRNYF